MPTSLVRSATERFVLIAVPTIAFVFPLRVCAAAAFCVAAVCTKRWWRAALVQLLHRTATRSFTTRAQERVAQSFDEGLRSRRRLQTESATRVGHTHRLWFRRLLLQAASRPFAASRS